MKTTHFREMALQAVREERLRQISLYGLNDDTLTGFAGSVTPCPWLLPYSDTDSIRVEAAFRADYERYVKDHGAPTWMHLIREEVSELFAAKSPGEVVTEALQVSALGISLVENVLRDARG